MAKPIVDFIGVQFGLGNVTAEQREVVINGLVRWVDGVTEVEDRFCNDNEIVVTMSLNERPVDTAVSDLSKTIDHLIWLVHQVVIMRDGPVWIECLPRFNERYEIIKSSGNREVSFTATAIGGDGSRWPSYQTVARKRSEEWIVSFVTPDRSVARSFALHDGQGGWRRAVLDAFGWLVEQLDF